MEDENGAGHKPGLEKRSKRPSGLRKRRGEWRRRRCSVFDGRFGLPQMEVAMAPRGTGSPTIDERSPQTYPPGQELPEFLSRESSF